MYPLLKPLILAASLVLMHAVWQPVNAATAYCNGLDCAQCEVDLNGALASPFIANNTYAFLCARNAGGELSVAFSPFLNASPVIFADYDTFSDSCSVFVDSSVTATPIATEVPGMDRPSINAWKKVLREVCHTY
jgi:hypothetical protein